MEFITLKNKHLTARVNPDNQQLCSLKTGDHEFMHGAALPVELQNDEDKQGWNQTEIVMFPVVGPIKENSVLVDGVAYPMAQHGIVRHRHWTLVQHTAERIVYKQVYHANDHVPNTKMAMPLQWPFSFEIEKIYHLQGKKLIVEFRITNTSSESMPYALGWHPAFKTFTGNKEEEGSIEADRHIRLVEIREASKTGALLLAVPVVAYANTNNGIEVYSNFGHFMLWSPTPSELICIEPTTMLPVWSGFEYFTASDKHVKPGETIHYFCEIIVR